MKQPRHKSPKAVSTSTPASYPWRAVVCLGAAAVLAAGSALDYFAVTSKHRLADPYNVSDHVQRFRSATAQLSTDGVIGYISDVPIEDPRGQTAFFLAQYALAPKLLTAYDSPHKPSLVIGSFSKYQDYAEFGSSHGLEYVRDLGQGLALYHRKDR